ncbi:MAG: hypothetical protein WDZ35_03550 [Crocinitomicaceae bacterium]
MNNNKMTPKTKKYQMAIIAPLLLLTLALMNTKCGKDNPPPEEPTLPPATQTGENTFGCKINGKVYVPKGTVYEPSIDQPAYYESYGYFIVTTRNVSDFSDDRIDDILLRLKVSEGVSGNGLYMMTDTGFSFFEIQIDTVVNGFETGHSYNYYLDTTKSNLVEITNLDVINKVISGTFEMTVINNEQNDTITITEGRFDLKDPITE